MQRLFLLWRSYLATAGPFLTSSLSSSNVCGWCPFFEIFTNEISRYPRCSQKAFEISDDKTHGTYQCEFRVTKGSQFSQYFEIPNFVLTRIYCALTFLCPDCISWPLCFLKFCVHFQCSQCSPHIFFASCYSSQKDLLTIFLQHHLAFPNSSFFT